MAPSFMYFLRANWHARRINIIARRSTYVTVKVGTNFQTLLYARVQTKYVSTIEFCLGFITLFCLYCLNFHFHFYGLQSIKLNQPCYWIWLTVPNNEQIQLIYGPVFCIFCMFETIAGQNCVTFRTLKHMSEKWQLQWVTEECYCLYLYTAFQALLYANGLALVSRVRKCMDDIASQY
jgi:hypothetical protein